MNQRERCPSDGAAITYFTDWLGRVDARCERCGTSYAGYVERPAMPLSASAVSVGEIDEDVMAYIRLNRHCKMSELRKALIRYQYGEVKQSVARLRERGDLTAHCKRRGDATYLMVSGYEPPVQPLTLGQRIEAILASGGEWAAADLASELGTSYNATANTLRHLATLGKVSRRLDKRLEPKGRTIREIVVWWLTPQSPHAEA